MLSLEVIGHLGQVAELARLQGVDGGRGLGAHEDAIAFPFAHQERPDLGAVAAAQVDFQLWRVEAVAAGVLSPRSHDVLPLEGPRGVQEVVDLGTPGRALRRLDHAPLSCALALKHGPLASPPDGRALDVVRLEAAEAPA